MNTLSYFLDGAIIYQRERNMVICNSNIFYGLKALSDMDFYFPKVTPCEWQCIPVALQQVNFLLYLLAFIILCSLFCPAVPGFELLRMQEFKLCHGCTTFDIFFGLFETSLGDPVSHGSIVYTLEQLLAPGRPGLHFTNKT